MNGVMVRDVFFSDNPAFPTYSRTFSFANGPRILSSLEVITQNAGMLTIRDSNGRTVTQRYDGPSRWEFLRELKEIAGDRVVLGSGDLFNAQACLDMIRYTGVDGVTVARGAIGNPWIFSQARALAAGKPLPEPPSLHQQRDVICEHYRLAEESYGAERCLPDMRKFAIKYARLHPRYLEVRADFCGVKEPGGWRGVLAKWYVADGPGVHPPVDEPNPLASVVALASA